MAISTIIQRALWANSAGRCAFEECHQRLVLEGASTTPEYLVGEIAHICGNRPEAERYDSTQSQDKRDGYENLLLLCPTHHALIDKPGAAKVFTVERLREMKFAHEKFVAESLTKDWNSKYDVAIVISDLLNENKIVFEHLGPKSAIAGRNSQSSAHLLWLSERLATIVPNNRRISEVLKSTIDFFDESEKYSIRRFLLHARGYEGWVMGKHEYEGILRFPTDFDSMIKGVLNGSSQ